MKSCPSSTDPVQIFSKTNDESVDGYKSIEIGKFCFPIDDDVISLIGDKIN